MVCSSLKLFIWKTTINYQIRMHLYSFQFNESPTRTFKAKNNISGLCSRERIHVTGFGKNGLIAGLVKLIFSRKGIY